MSIKTITKSQDFSSEEDYVKEAVTASYVKINTLWNDRDFDWNVVDRGEFWNNPLNMLRVTVLESRNSEHYEYDLSGNRTGGIEYYRNSTGGNTSLRKNDGAWTYVYDANGNRVSKKSVSGESWTYKWDLHNRLIEVTQKNPVDRGTPVHVSYEYDGLNHRISRTGTDGSKTEYAYGRNGAVIVERTGSSIRSYVYANGVIAGFVDTDGEKSETRYCVTDHQGSVKKIVDENGSVLWEGCYTAFGVKGGESVDRIEFTGMFTGKDIDPETGLTYHWNRWRSENGSVWLSEDPARDGTNWYGYCGNNPVMYTDPNGLFAYGTDGQYSTINKESEQKSSNVSNFVDGMVTGFNNSVSALTNLDFGMDCGQNAWNSFSNGDILGGIVWELNGMTEVVVDFGLALTGAGVLGAGIASAGTLFTTGSTTAAYLSWQYNLQNNLGIVTSNINNGLNTLSQNFINFTKEVTNFTNKSVENINTKILKNIPLNKISNNPKDDIFRRGYNYSSISYQKKYYSQYGKFDTSNEPIVVYDIGQGNYMLQNGHHRYKAALELGLETLKVDEIIPYNKSMELGVTNLPRNLIPKE